VLEFLSGRRSDSLPLLTRSLDSLCASSLNDPLLRRAQLFYPPVATLYLSPEQLPERAGLDPEVR